MKTQALKKALNKYKFDFILAGARRDEEKVEQKKEFFHLEIIIINGSKKQRPEVWGLFNAKLKDNTTMSVPAFKLTEIDIWNYIKVEKIPIVDLYFPNSDQSLKVYSANDRWWKIKISQKE